MSDVCEPAVCSGQVSGKKEPKQLVRLSIMGNQAIGSEERALSMGELLR